MTQERYVAAIEISSSKITGVVGRYSGEGQLVIEAAEQESLKEGVRYGIVQNLEETSLRLSRIIDRLQRNPKIAPRKITGVFTGLSGRSLRSIPTTVRVDLPEETEITEAVVENLRQKALNSIVDNSLEIIDAVPCAYRVGNNETNSPIGTLGSEISATFDIIVCRAELKRNLLRTIQDKCGLDIRGLVVTPIATGHLILSDDEKRLGCMLVDMGSETTTVSIYQKGSLTYMATLPLGGRNITRDLTTLPLLEEKAEEMKISVGNAIAGEATSSLNFNGIRSSDVSNIIVARSEEIVANILEQISYAGLKDKDLPGGIVCIGGASRLNGMVELLNRQSGLQVRNGRLPGYIHVPASLSATKDLIQVECVLYEGATLSEAQCLEEPHTEELPATGQIPEDPVEDDRLEDRREREKENKVQKFVNRFQSRISRLFAAPDDEDSDLLD